jgi:ElaB/YqjD/DUF883 family membrane-anchored ribosome-binding protein
MATATETVQGLAAQAGAYAWPTLDAVEEGTRRARRALVDVRHKAEDAAADARLAVRRHPLAAVGVGLATGAFIGAACGLVFAWLTRSRESRS